MVCWDRVRQARRSGPCQALNARRGRKRWHHSAILGEAASVLCTLLRASFVLANPPPPNSQLPVGTEHRTAIVDQGGQHPEGVLLAVLQDAQQHGPQVVHALAVAHLRAVHGERQQHPPQGCLPLRPGHPLLVGEGPWQVLCTRCTAQQCSEKRCTAAVVAVILW